MEVGQVKETLTKIFVDEEQRIVFWNDPEREFIDLVADIVDENVTLVRLDQESALKIKCLVEIDDPDGLYLIYDPNEEPSFDEDWFLDLRLCSRAFRADRSSMILSDLGLTQLQLREHIDSRRKFFDNKERVLRLKQIIQATDCEADLDRKMIAVVVKSEQPEFFHVLRTVFHSMVKDDDVELNVVPKAWQEIEKFGLDIFFWESVKTKFGYAEESPSLKGLLIRLLVSDFLNQSRIETPPAFRSFELPSSGTANATVCLAQWRDSASLSTSYNAISEQLGAVLYIENILNEVSLDKLLHVDTFEVVERVIVIKLAALIKHTLDTVNADEVQRYVRKRQDAHWISSSSVKELKRKVRLAMYDALAKAANLFSRKNLCPNGLRFSSAQEMYRAYEANLFKFDQLYRQFCENADVLERESIDILKPLRRDVENVYCNWFLNHLSLGWGTYVGGGLLNAWEIQGIKNQHSFFRENIQRHLDKTDRKRIFVIISDAFRYEVAEELTSELNGKYRIQAELRSQLGVVPSYTSLGMASLLPHNQIQFNSTGDVLVDGRPTSSLENRNLILNDFGGIAVDADTLLGMNQIDGRKMIQEKKIVYIYHNEIDARGDKAVTENDTFAACRDAIDELASLVKYVINNLNGNHVLVTADHGFIFTESGPVETDRSRLSEKPDGTVKAKKRYLIGRALPDVDGVWHGRTLTTASASGEMEFWIPKGISRFHFVGGAKFVHGGAMLQEIVVPIIEVRHVKDDTKRETTRLREVGVQVLSTRHKVTTQKHKFTLYQTEPVSERVKPATIKIGLYEGSALISDLQTVTFESSSDKMDDRQKNIILTLQEKEYDKTTSYKLILQDRDGIELERIDVTIDRMINDDF